MKELPKVFQNNINKNFSNNNKFYYGNDERKYEQVDTKSIREKINKIFASANYVYKANVKIITKNGEYTKKIIGRNKNYIITMDNALIPIEDIINIEVEKK